MLLKIQDFLELRGGGVLVLPINFKSDTQTEEMGVGTARLLFQVFSTLIYIYRHLTNPPQSPNCISQLYFTSLYICISLCCLYLPFSTWLIYRSHQIEMSPSSLPPLPPTYANSNPNILMSSFEKVFSNNSFLNYMIEYSIYIQKKSIPWNFT